MHVSCPTGRRMSSTRRSRAKPERSEGVGSIRMVGGRERSGSLFADVIRRPDRRAGKARSEAKPGGMLYAGLLLHLEASIHLLASACQLSQAPT
jgi:hypothetical protein